MNKIIQPEPRFEHAAVHGRFQPPLNYNHWNYVLEGLSLCEKLTIYLTNPYGNEAPVGSASWRSDPAANPFSFEDRKSMIFEIFKRAGLDSKLHTIEPLNIRDPEAIKALPDELPQIVNVYSAWSAEKAAAFEAAGKNTVRLSIEKEDPRVSGTVIREKLRDMMKDDGYQRFDPVYQQVQFESQAILAGMIPESVPGLWQRRATLL
jgi:nicotinamide mononucleotide adenylyltransferase